jgi:taurine dioxygenase
VSGSRAQRFETEDAQLGGSTLTSSLTPLTKSVGAIVEGLDLRKPLGADAVQALRAAVLERGVLFFRGQEISREQMLAFMENFGTPCADPFAVIDRPSPALDTIIDNPTLAYRKATALWHTDSSLAERVHPETGRKALFVNELWTERIVES